MAASLGILVIRSSLVDWQSMKKSADMRGTVVLMAILFFNLFTIFKQKYDLFLC
jgi:hypothetical protein